MGGQKRYRLQQKQRKWHKKGRRVNDIKARSLNKKDKLTRLLEKIRKTYSIEDD